MSDLIGLDLAELTRRVRRCEVTVTEVVGAHLARIEAVNGDINAVVTPCDDRALAQAEHLDERLAAGDDVGSLCGVPYVLKDAFDVKGVRTAVGMRERLEHVADRDATIVTRVETAGAILLGKTNTPPMTLSYDTDNPAFGPTRNPYDLERSPGGSTAGAAIVAAGGAVFDIGSDTGGSIRLPAHFSGIAGVKPTAGRVPRTGLVVGGGVPVDPLTQVGPVARRVADLVSILRRLEGVDHRDPGALPLAPLADLPRVTGRRVAWFTDNGIVAASSPVAAAVRDAAAALADAGADAVEALPVHFDDTIELFTGLFGVDGGAWRRRLRARLAHTEPQPERREPPSAVDAVLLAERLSAYRQRMLTILDDVDLLVCPVHTDAALRPDELAAPARYPSFSFTQPWNLTGWPAVTVPAAMSPEGLPIGVQVVAGPGHDALALAAAAAIEQRVDGVASVS